MNIPINTLTADKVISRILIVSMILFVVTAVYIGFSYLKLPPFIPLFNQAPWGEGRLAARIFLLLPIGCTGIIFVSNCVIAALLYGKVPLLSRMLTITTFLISLLIFVYYFRTLHLII